MFTRQDVSLFRLVNGIVVEMSDEERDAIAAKWNETAAKPAPPRSLTLEDVVAALEAHGNDALKAALADRKRG